MEVANTKHYSYMANLNTSDNNDKKLAMASSITRITSSNSVNNPAQYSSWEYKPDTNHVNEFDPV